MTTPLRWFAPIILIVIIFGVLTCMLPKNDYSFYIQEDEQRFEEIEGLSWNEQMKMIEVAAIEQSLISVQEAMQALRDSVNSNHFSRGKHQGDSPNPDSIKQMITTASCNPISIWQCVSWESTQRIKFTCSIGPEVAIGISIALDERIPWPLAVTAFPSSTDYWSTAGIEGCVFVGMAVHP